MIFYNTYMGRLGNKMFIYACAVSLYKERGFNYVFDDPILFQCFRQSTKQRIFHWMKLKYFWWVVHKFFFKGNVDMSDCNKIYSNDEFINNSITTGYFQSHLYFEKYTSQIIDLFEIREIYKRKYLQISSQLNQTLPNLVLHVRRTDYLSHQPNNNEIVGCILPVSYYQKIFTLEKIENYNLIFISDDIDFCKKQFSHLHNTYFSDNEFIVDLQFMINAEICVISNSTFSWWGAYLNKKRAKVYAPKYFLGINDKTEYPVNIFPKEWIQVNTN